MWVIRLRTLYVCIERSIWADLIIGEVLLKNLPSSTLSLQMYSWEHICNELYNSLWFQNPFIKTSAILLCYSSTSYRWSTRIMSFNPPQPQSSHIGNACSRKPVCSVAEELYQHSVIIQLSLLLSSRLPLFLLSDSMYEGILKCNNHETYLLSLALNNAIYPTNLR